MKYITQYIIILYYTIHNCNIINFEIFTFVTYYDRDKSCIIYTHTHNITHFLFNTNNSKTNVNIQFHR